MRQMTFIRSASSLRPIAIFIAIGIGVGAVVRVEAATPVDPKCGKSNQVLAADTPATPTDPVMGPPTPDPALLKADALRDARHQLENLLGFNADAFGGLRAGNMDQAASIWARLHDHFPLLTKVADAVREQGWNGTEVPNAIEADTLHAVNHLITNKSKDTAALQGGVEALRKLEFVHRLKFRPKEEPAAEKKTEEKTQEKEDKDKPPPKKKEPKKPAKPKIDGPEDEYKVGQEKKDQDDSDGGESKVSVASVNEHGVRLFRRLRYQGVDAATGKWVTLEMNEPRPILDRYAAQKTMSLNTSEMKGAKQRLYVPDGFIPQEFEAAEGKVWQDGAGNYHYFAHGDRLDVPLMRQTGVRRPLSPAERDIYLHPTGVKLTEWPEHVQRVVNELKKARAEGKFTGSEGDVMIARILGEYIATNFEYTKYGDASKTTMEYAADGAFKCDRATTMWVSILRDHFGIASAPAGGQRGHANEREPGTSHLVTPDEGHAWGEVVDADGNWHVVDPTPRKNRDKQENNPDEGPFKPFTDPNAKPEESDSKEDDGKTDHGDGDPTDGEGSAPGQNQKLRQLIDEEVARQKAKRAERESHGKDGEAGEVKKRRRAGEPGEGKDATEGEPKKSEEGKEGGKGKDEKGEGKDGKDEHEGRTGEKKDGDKPYSPGESAAAKEAKGVEEALKRLKLDFNAFSERLLREMVAWAIDPSLSSRQKAERLDDLRVLAFARPDDLAKIPKLKHLDPKNLKGLWELENLRKVVEALTPLFKGKHPPFADRLENILDVEKPVVWKVGELVKLRRELEVTLRVLNDRDRAPIDRLLDSVDHLLERYGEIKHPDARAIRLSEELLEGLPGNITRSLLRDSYGIKGAAGPNPQTLSLAKAISEGKHNDERLMSILGPHTDWLTDPIPRPATQTLRTWVRQTRNSTEVKSLIPTTDQRDTGRGRKIVNLRPDLPFDEALQRGDILALARRKTVDIPMGEVGTDPEKITIIGIDVSGSMNGDRAEFQSMYVGALVDRALSDTGPDGKARHRVIIVPFGDSVLENEKIEVTSAKEARALLPQLRKKTGNRNMGTNIESFLLWAAREIKTAKDSGNKLLSRANVLLATDGGAPVNNALVKAEFDKVGNNTDVLLGLIAIGEQNAALVEMAENKGVGVDKAQYVHWSDAEIGERLAESKAKAEPKNDFWVPPDQADTPGIRDATARAKRALKRFRNEWEKPATEPTQFEELRRVADEASQHFVDERPDTENHRLRTMRVFLDTFGPWMNENDRKRVLGNVMHDWKSMFKVGSDGLDRAERSQLFWILKWPRHGTSDGTGGTR